MHRRSRQTRPLAVAASLLAALILVIGAVSLSPATADTAMSPLELAQVQQANCQVLLAHATTSAARTRARQCIADQQVIIDALSGSPTPTPSATQTPSPSPSPTVQPSPSSSPTTSTAPATTPPASTSPSPTGLLTDCFSQLAACGYPTTASTGIPAFAPMSAYSGPLSITSDTTITGKTIGCGLTIRGGTTTIRSSKITGPCFYGIDMEGGSLVIEDSEINCVDNRGTGIAYTNFTARRVLVRNCENGFHVGSNTLIEDSYITGVVEVGGGHGDGIQGQSGSNIVVRHTTFDLVNPITSSIIWDRLTMDNVLVENNFFAAGAYTVYVPTGGSNVVYRNNRFFGPVAHGDTSDHRPAYGFSTGANRSGVTWTGNYRDDTLGSVSAA